MDIDWLLEQHEDKYMKRDDGCWVWTGARAGGNRPGETEGRYGYVNIGGGEMRYVHRLAVGNVPDGKHVLHKCDNPPCFNPDHLYVGSRSDNMSDAVERGQIVAQLDVLKDARQKTGYDKTGGEHPASQLSESERREIRDRYQNEDIYQKELANEYGVSRPTISRVVRGKDYAE